MCAPSFRPRLMNGSITVTARCAAVLERRPAHLRQAAMLDLDVVGADRAFEHLQRGVVRAGQFLHHDRNVGEVARHLQRRRRRSGSPAPPPPRAAPAMLPPRAAALEPVDARPFADVVAVGRAAIEQLLLEPRHDRLADRVLLAVRVGGRESDVEPRFFEQAFLDADDDRQVENLVVGRNPDHGLWLVRRHPDLLMDGNAAGPPLHTAANSRQG